MAHKTAEQFKLIQGTQRKDRAAIDGLQLPLAEEIPKPPDWLNTPMAIDEFKRLASILFYNKILTEASITPLAMLCATFGKICEMFKGGEMPSGHVLTQYRGMCNDFGLTPKAQSSIKGGGSSDKGKNKFSNNGKRA